MPQKAGNVSVRISPDVQKKLDHIADSLDRSRNWLINEAIENYLDIFEWQEQRITQRLSRAENKGKFLNSSQVDIIVESFKP